MNNNTDLLKLIAMITMFCDHAGKMLFPHYPVMRMIGRLAFPIYAYCIAVGCVYTKDPLRYLKRIVLMALICQPIYAVSMAHTTAAMYSISFAEHPVRAAINFYVQSWHHPSIFVALAFGIILIWALRNRQIILFIGVALLCWKIKAGLDYGWKGLVLMLLFYCFCDRPILAVLASGAFMAWWGLQGTQYSLFGIRFQLQMYMILSLIPIAIPMQRRMKLNKWVFYAFYPGHLALIYVLDHFVFH
ncbi:MAG: conjugal transfer protein TraX [Clostridia bacterium]|nr:conjugal transfer protein TraX [Clostridia bacterium]